MNWIGEPPKMCDICGCDIINCFIDGKTRNGPWAIMCMTCFIKHGIGLGVGLGQKFEKFYTTWIKVQG